MKIYTKKGDDGQTSLGDGQRVAKDSPFTTAYGCLDELNATIGLSRSFLDDSNDMDAMLARVQRTLFAIGAVLANPKQLASVFAGQKLDGIMAKANIRSDEVAWLEEQIDAFEESLTPLKTFILPAGSQVASALHVARTVSRRAERELVSLGSEVQLPALYLIYLNRLSDFLFVAARYANHRATIEDTPW